MGDMLKMIRILTTCFNAEKYIAKCIKSIQLQSYSNFKCYITDDMSTDKSVEIAKLIIGKDFRFEIIQNKEKLYQTGNYYTVLQKEEIQNDDICITIDGDDWLAHTKVFERIVKEYENPDCWMTYGSFVYYKGANQYEAGFAQPPRSGIENQRTDPAYTTTHLRTWKASLFRKIKMEDLLMPEGWFIPMAGDLAFMFPMLEMAGKEHSRFIPENLYVYNIETNTNEFKVNMALSDRCAKLIRNKQPYKKL
jgi:glycosyltransferase involved in cell wall biosynthesis